MVPQQPMADIGTAAGPTPAEYGEALEMDQLALTIPEACNAARLGRTTLYAAIKNGELAAAKCGRKTIIRLDDLKDWLANLPNISSNGRAAACAARDAGGEA